jgi:iron complex outermembrane receptor protein
VAWAAPLQAQQATGTIRGRVVDDAQQPLARVTVAVGARGTFTAADGRYVISGVPAGAVTLRARMLGYAPVTREVTVVAGYPVVVDFAMTSQAISLSEVVVTGYGEQTAGDITGAVTHLSAEDFNPGRITAPAQLLQSKVAGVQVVDNNEPGGGTTIRIRGATSWTASSDPLYVVDGMPLGTGSGGGLSAGRDPLNFINPNDIQSIVVLKDASAAAIYGANAANGVVLITTKSGAGRQGQQLEYTSSASTSSVTRLPQVLNAAQFLAAVTAQAPSKVSSLGSANTSWLDLITRTAFGQEQNVSLTNAGERSYYRLSFGYLNQNGIIKGTTTERLSMGLNYDQHLLGEHLDIKANLKGSRANDQFSGGALGEATGMAPTQPVYNANDPTGFWDWRNTNAGTFNPLAELALATNKGTTWRSVGNVQADYRFPFLETLRANINLGYDVAKAGNSTFYPSDLASQTLQGHGNLYLSNNTQMTSLFEGYLNYTAPLGFVPGTVDITGGYSYTQSHGDYTSFNQGSLASNFLGIYGNPGGTIAPTNNVSAVDYKLISFFGRFNYNYSDRYLASVSVRHDGSSRFGPGRQWGTFPAVSGAWRLSQESFLHGISALSDLKLRVSWAHTGNQAFGDYLAYPTYTYGDAAVQYYLGGQFVTTIRPSAVDKNIHWESTRSWDVGLDYGFSNQRFSGAIDWYTKKTNDMLFYVPIAAGATFSNYVTTNVGTMQNRGIEANLSARILQGRGGDLSWTADFTVSHNANKLISINPSQSVTSINVGSISGGVGNTIQVLLPGSPISSFYVYQHKTGANGQPVWATGAHSDTLMYVDQNHDGVINNLDRRPFHSPFPTLELGHTSSFTYHSFDFSFTLRAQLGNYVYNNVAAANGSYQNITGSANPSNMDVSILKTGFGTVQYFSDYYVENASFLRMDNITLGYTFPIGGRSWRVYVTAQNVFTITGYSGVDPTAGLNGIDNNIYPRSRTFTGGLSVRF